MLRNPLLLGASSLTLVFLVGATACTEATSNGAMDAGSEQADGAQANGGQNGGDAGSDGAPFTGPIATECTGALEWCAQVEVDARLACKDVDGNDYGVTTRISGKTDAVSCTVEDTGAKDGSSHDLALTIQPPQADTEAYNTHAVQFWLADYKGAGTYPLESLEAGDYRNRGIWFQGAASGSQTDEKTASAGSEVCKPSPCRAIVAEESEPIGHDEYNVQAFRVRVEIQCTDGGELWSHPDCEQNSRCTVQGTPTLKFDVVCTH